MYEADVPLLAGTDAGYVYIIPGFSLLDEIIELFNAGIPKLAAIQTATINPAKYFDRVDSLGTVEPGKLADLVLLDANPLEDLNNLKKINATILNGRLFDKDALEKMKRDVLISNYRSALKDSPPVKPVNLEIDLKKYTGEYSRKGSERSLNIMLSHGVLSIEYGFTVDRLEPFSERLFRAKGSNTYYSFFLNQQNEIEGFEILFNGRAVQYFKVKQ